MKTMKTLSLAAVAALSLMSASAFAQTVTATGSTLDGFNARWHRSENCCPG